MDLKTFFEESAEKVSKNMALRRVSYCVGLHRGSFYNTSETITTSFVTIYRFRVYGRTMLHVKIFESQSKKTK